MILGEQGARDFLNLVSAVRFRPGAPATFEALEGFPTFFAHAIAKRAVQGFRCGRPLDATRPPTPAHFGIALALAARGWLLRLTNEVRGA